MSYREQFENYRKQFSPDTIAYQARYDEWLEAKMEKLVEAVQNLMVLVNCGCCECRTSGEPFECSQIRKSADNLLPKSNSPQGG